MSVKYILGQAGAKMGLNPQDPLKRPTLLRFLNEAARELYPQADPPGSLMEQGFKVNGDQTLSLPAYVGKIRGIRELASMQVWHVNQMRPRYNQFNWKDMWRNYRLKNKQALMQSIDNQSILIVSVPFIESPPIVVSVGGPTINSAQATEQIVMDALTKQSTNTYLDLDYAKKPSKNLYDITVSQVDGKLLTVIPNNLTSAQYQIVDVSACPWLPMNTSILDNFMEILYKRTLPYLFDDDDEYPAFDYDDIVVNKIMQLWKEEQDKPEIAIGYDTKATRSMARIKEDQDKDTEDEVALVSHPHDTLLRRIGTGLRRRYSLYAGRKN